MSGRVLCFGEDPDSETAEAAVHGLRVMVRLGRRAERALAAIERGEDFPDFVAWIDMRTRRLRTSGSVSRVRLPSWDTLPGKESLDVRFGEPEVELVGQAEVRVFPVHLVGEGFRPDPEGVRDGQPFPGMRRVSYSGDEPRSIVGYVRMKSGGHFTFKPEGETDDPRGHRVSPILADGHSRNWNAVRSLAYMAAAVLVPSSILVEGFTCPDLVHLRTKLPDWIVSSGMAADWVRRIRAHAESLRTVMDVMAR